MPHDLPAAPVGCPPPVGPWLAGPLQTGQGLARETDREPATAHCRGTSPAPPTAWALPPHTPGRAAPALQHRAEALHPRPRLAGHLHRPWPHVPPALSAPREACQRQGSQNTRQPRPPEAARGLRDPGCRVPVTRQGLCCLGDRVPSWSPTKGGLWVPVPASPPQNPSKPRGGEGRGLHSAPGRRASPRGHAARARQGTQGLPTLPFTETVTRPSLWPSVPPHQLAHVGEPWWLTHRHGGGQGTGGVGAQSPCPKRRLQQALPGCPPA